MGPDQAFEREKKLIISFLLDAKNSSLRTTLKQSIKYLLFKG